MIKVNKLTDYSVKILCSVAEEAGLFLSAVEISKKIGLSKSTVSKILKLLAKGNLLISQRGAEGGYSLAKSSQAITVAEVIRVMEGPIFMTECSNKLGSCVHERQCKTRPHWQKINTAILHALEAVSIADMLFN